MQGWLTMGLLLPGAALAQCPAGHGAATAGALLLWPCLAGSVALLLFWAAPIVVALLVAGRGGLPPAPALLWAAGLGWVGLLIYHTGHTARRCPHCRTAVEASSVFCDWCGSDTQPIPRPELRVSGSGSGEWRRTREP